MKTILYVFLAFLGTYPLSAQKRTAEIKTSVGTLKICLYDNVPNHVRTFIARANKGEYNGTLFTRVIKEFMIQGGAPDSRNAPPGARCGFGDRSTEILPEFLPQYFHKKGTLAAPRQNDDINSQKKSDMSQFFIVQGKIYRGGELDTLEKVANLQIRRKAMAEFYKPFKMEMEQLKTKDPKTYNKRVIEINNKVDSVIRSTPGHLLFTPKQREAYTTIGGCHHLDGHYTIFGEVTEGLDIIDKIASQATDVYDRPKKDIRIISVIVN
ncbi:MAG: peptidylprolyl isomerase [Massilibacteroides sp.]|nr:peptidylprolyl isomerase [Massilibacteroides sp.]MDD3061635.1 peptidylprolyl isomerase [Massilibacteroides sp.]MDD4114902.1 peptidylprolyl isomerase [Massilibacteroides sp.]MDD4659981.1 peptidylprolyl isomerase [Massilibacteroides sp.]